jgi:hypothetical protein
MLWAQCCKPFVAVIACHDEAMLPRTETKVSAKPHIRTGFVNVCMPTPGKRMKIDMPKNDRVLVVSEEQGVVFLTLNRPKQLNALSLDMLYALHAALDAVASDERARVVVIAASGNAFCAGHDLKELRAGNDAESVAKVFRLCADFMLK